MRPLDLPPGWARGHELVPQIIGESGAWVYRAGEAHFIKSEPISPLAELPGEIERLRWLHGTGLACPEVIHTAEHDGRHWLLMTALPGHDLASTSLLNAETAARLMAEALRQLHALDPASCPFDHRVGIRIRDASARYHAGLYDGDDPSQGPADYARLITDAPVTEDLVVTHGDACFPNFMAEDGRFTGFIDCGRLGVADRYQDLALACRSLEYNYGAAAVPSFLAAYGVDAPDEAKLDWYMLLDEFF
ncbi:APH(3') family aminoglycoside O-phosphotransferase [Devosia sp. A16]|uniref:APH(3') family aminoglycoside O-phosphotransferase n=1 Tax=Devosia sp. A16 TaxID=1736675 RepID=UPI0006D80C7D|nr:APH(3') family aminoglycoside O-phosphotransferase [Devosia sp. A16]